LIAIDQSDEWGHFVSLQEIAYDQSTADDNNATQTSDGDKGTKHSDGDRNIHDSSSSSSSGDASSSSGGTTKVHYTLAVFKRL